MTEDQDTRVRHCADAENDDPRQDRIDAIASRAMRAMREGGRDEQGRSIRP
jgi:hypothetical protein